MTVRNNRSYNATLGAAEGIPDTITIRSIWLLYEGGEHDPDAKAVVLVQLPNGTYRRAIVERLDGPFSHCVHPEGIRNSPAQEEP